MDSRHNFGIITAFMNAKEQTYNSASPVTEPPRAARIDRTLSLSIIEGCAWAVMWGFGESFVGPFAVFLKADDFLMSLLCTLPIILGSIAQLIGATVIERLGRRRPLCAITTAIQSFGYLPLFWLPFLFPEHGAPIAVGLATCMLVSCHLGTPGFNSMMGDLVPEAERGSYFGKRMATNMMVMLISMITAGRIATYFEHRHQVWLGFGVIFSIALVARGISSYLLTRYYEPPFNPSPGTSISFIEFLRQLLHTNFGRFTLGMTLMTFGSTISAPFFTQYMIRDLHWTKDHFAVSTAVLLLSQFVFIRWWGHICDKHGNRATIRATSLILPILPLLWVITKDYYLILAIQVLSGIAWSGINLASSNFIYDSIPADQRHRIFGYYNVVNGMFTLVGGSVVGAWCALNMPSSYSFGGIHIVFLSSLPAVFIVSGLVRALVGILMLPHFKEVRVTEPITSRQILWRISTGEPIFNRITEIMDTLPSPFRSSDLFKK